LLSPLLSAAISGEDERHDQIVRPARSLSRPRPGVMWCAARSAAARSGTGSSEWWATPQTRPSSASALSTPCALERAAQAKMPVRLSASDRRHGPPPTARLERAPDQVDLSTVTRLAQTAGPVSGSWRGNDPRHAPELLRRGQYRRPRPHRMTEIPEISHPLRKTHPQQEPSSRANVAADSLGAD
jgi:hypothetical protein